MLELPEVITLYHDLKNTIVNKKIIYAKANSSLHKFAFYYKDPNEYEIILKNQIVQNVTHYGFYVSIETQDFELLFRDGVNLRYHKDESTIPKKHQLIIGFLDNTYLTVTISMYGVIWCVKKGQADNEKYYKIAKSSILPTSEKFDISYYNQLFYEAKDTISAKAFLATEQRINGIGNGVLQDILFMANIHPKKKLNTFSEENKIQLYYSIKDTLNAMIKNKGRDTEKNLFDQFGGYKTILSKNTVGKPCPNCEIDIKKENYLGGSIYFCSNCQKI